MYDSTIAMGLERKLLQGHTTQEHQKGGREIVREMSGEDELGPRIAQACVAAYGRLSKRGKPQPHEWTLIAGIVAEVRNGTYRLACVCVCAVAF